MKTGKTGERATARIFFFFQTENINIIYFNLLFGVKLLKLSQ